ncbi:MAG: hypothetical protein QT02_C0001G0041 [archaeon GW2011_AR9]|nr:MAG: hypothetical protein QT02_C0001G0041 [archaeon GW2011_AR9]MBS3120228.1 hypothetical protein [Candidatus Woesearchaeota archaeon]HIH12658.1 hypothetical protein [Candidatus Woesearchaeota archaeon]
MAHITLSLPDEAYMEMKRHPEIKWSEVARHAIIEKTLLLKKSMHTTEFVKLLSTETRKDLQQVPSEKWAAFTKAVKKAGWKRTKYLTRA